MSADPTLQVFFDEAAELLRRFEEGVLGLEAAPADPELLNAVFRAAHTIKGNSAMLGFERVAAFTHVLEESLSRLRAGDLVVDPAVVSTLLAARDVLAALLEEAAAGGPREIPDLARVTAALQARRRPGPAASGPAPAPAPARPAGPRRLYEIRFAPRGESLRRGLSPAGILEALRGLGELIRVDGDPAALPSAETLDPARAYPAFHCWLLSGAPPAAVEACFDFAEEGAARIDALELDDAPAAAPAAPAPAPPAAAPPLVERRVGERRRSAGPADADGQSIRVGIEKVDRLVDLVGELVISQSMVAQLLQDFDPGELDRLREAVALMDRHARDLQERVMAVRMLPIRTVFGRFARVVRDLAQSMGKRVVLETHGEDTELDKTVIERIGDPLTHLVRNAVDHGLEPPEERRQRGKPETGRLVLSAYQQGGSIYIEIQDDGRGLDRGRILARALELGLVGPGEVPGDEQVHALIFRPGFSTASRVTEVSGRGVGMDVVRRNVESLGGSIAIQSAAGAGTTFRITLPLTLAILEGQLLRVGSEIFVLPLVTILESVRPTREALGSVLGRGEVLRLRREVLPLLRLHRLFAIGGATEDPTRALIVVVESDGRRAALLVDELLGHQQVVIKSLEPHLPRVDGVGGATILGDGRVALILDVIGLIALAGRSGRRPRAA